MRARNLKPGFFTNEYLASDSEDPLMQILFAGLWCCADRKGRLEYRPTRLCAQVFPYRRSVGEAQVEAMLARLAELGFIALYGPGMSQDMPRNGLGDAQALPRNGLGTTHAMPKFSYIQVLKFEKHQRPHVRESSSEIPALTQKPDLGSAQASPRTRLGSVEPDLGCAEPALNPSSLNPHSLNPSSLNPSSPPDEPNPDPRTARARARRQERAKSPARRVSPSGSLAGQNRNGDQAELQRRAVLLLKQGLAPGDVAKTMQQYGVTVGEVLVWSQTAGRST